MPEQGIENLSFSQIPYFDCGIVGTGNQIRPVRVEINRVHSIAMSIIVLQQALGTAIKNFDLLVSATSSQASTIRVEFNIVDHTCVISESMDQVSVHNIPQFDSAIVRA